MAIRDSWAVHRERKRLTMVRFNVTVRQALYVLVLAASMWFPNAAAQACSDYPNGVIDSFPIVPAGEQIILEITAVLDDSSANVPSTQFVNTAKCDFGTYEIATQ